MSCCGQQNDPFGVGCCGGANVSRHCASSAFDSSCTDEGQGYPVSYPAKCKVFSYTPVPGVVAIWNGAEWVLDTDSSSGSDSSIVPPSRFLEVFQPTLDVGQVTSGGTLVLSLNTTGDDVFLAFRNLVTNPDTISFGPILIVDPSGLFGPPPFIPDLAPGDTNVGVDFVTNSVPLGTYTGQIIFSGTGDSFPFVINFIATTF